MQLSLLRSAVYNIQKRIISTSCTLYKKPEYDNFPDPLDVLTGVEKQELVARLAGNDDPFTMKALKRGEGTQAKPNLVPSAFASRMVGCVCEEDSHTVMWLWLHQGEPKRCMCGHWFKLVYKPAFSEYGPIGDI